MSELTYTEVVWTAGDIITEAKMDNMTANDRAVDAMYNGIRLAERANPDTPPANNLHLYAKDKSGVPTLYVINDAGTVYEIAETRPGFLATITGQLVIGTSLTPIIPVHRDLTIVKAFGIVKTAPVAQDIIIDINKNGSSLWSSTPANRLKILAGSSSGSQTSFDETQLAEGDALTFDVDQVGATIAGADLSILLRCKT